MDEYRRLSHTIQTLICFIILLFITDKESVQRLLVPFEKLGKTAFEFYGSNVTTIFLYKICVPI